MCSLPHGRQVTPYQQAEQARRSTFRLLGVAFKGETKEMLGWGGAMALGFGWVRSQFLRLDPLFLRGCV